MKIFKKTLSVMKAMVETEYIELICLKSPC